MFPFYLALLLTVLVTTIIVYVISVRGDNNEVLVIHEDNNEVLVVHHEGSEEVLVVRDEDNYPVLNEADFDGYSYEFVGEYLMTPQVYIIEEELDRHYYGKKAADHKSDLSYYRNYDDGTRGHRYGRTPRGKTLADKRGTRHVIEH